GGRGADGTSRTRGSILSKGIPSRASRSMRRGEVEARTRRGRTAAAGMRLLTASHSSSHRVAAPRPSAPLQHPEEAGGGDTGGQGDAGREPVAEAGTAGTRRLVRLEG